MTKFLQQSQAIFLQSPVHLSSGVSCFCFLQWHPHSHPNKDGEKDQEFNFPTTLPCQTFSLIIMRKSEQRGAWINGKEVYRCVDGSFQTSQERKDMFWLAYYYLGSTVPKTQYRISKPPYYILTKELDIIILIIGQVWVNKKCFKFQDCMQSALNCCQGYVGAGRIFLGKHYYVHTRISRLAEIKYF